MTKLRLVDKPAGAGGTKYEQLQADKAKYAAQKSNLSRGSQTLRKSLTGRSWMVKAPITCTQSEGACLMAYGGLSY